MPKRNARTIRFTFICNSQERQLIDAIAKHLDRSQGDAVRFLIRTAAQELRLDLEPQETRQTQGVGNG